MSEYVGERHSVDVPARGRCRRVRVAVGIEPNHAKALAALPERNGCASNRTRGDRMIAADRDRHSPTFDCVSSHARELYASRRDGGQKRADWPRTLTRAM